jgi:hypothetical protein
MRRVLRALGLILVMATSSSHAQQVPGVQGCVGSGCTGPVAVPGVQGCVGMGCKPCDDEALKKAKAERDKWLKIYKEQVAAAEDTRQREAEALDDARKEFNKFAEKIADKGVVVVDKKIYNVPDEVVVAWKEAKISNSSAPATEKFLKLTKMYLEELFKEAGYKTAVNRAKWIDTAASGVLMDAKVLMKLKEAEFHAEQAYKQWLLAYESLMKARLAEDKARRLEAQCKTQQGSRQAQEPAPEEGDKTSGEREAEQAQKMMEQWKAVEGGFLDAEGDFHDADTAFEEALSIVQERQSSWISPNGRIYLVSGQGEAAFQEEWKRFKVPMIQAFQRLVIGLEAYQRAEGAFQRLSKPQRTPDCIGLGCGEGERTCIGLGCGKHDQKCIGHGCSKESTLGVTLAVSGKTGARPIGRHKQVQRGEIRVTASVTGVSSTGQSPLYRFAVRTSQAAQPFVTSGEFAVNPTWSWDPNMVQPGYPNYPFPFPNGGSLVFMVTVKASGPQGTMEKTAEAGPYVLVDDAAARVAFADHIFPVMRHPRCVNCHNGGDSPTQGDDRHTHVPTVNRQTTCTQCHGNMNGTTPGSPPGAFGWRLPPVEFSFTDKTADRLCRQLKDPAQTGGKNLEQLREHFQKDPIIEWAWSPGPGRAAPPDSWEGIVFSNEFIGSFPFWMRAGAACPDPATTTHK